jgi:hypothetical protein
VSNLKPHWRRWSWWTNRNFPVSRVSIALHRASHALTLGNVAETVKYARRALDLASDDDHLGRGATAALLGLASWASGVWGGKTSRGGISAMLYAMLDVLWHLLTTRRWQRQRPAVTRRDEHAPDQPVPSTAMHASAATLDTWAFCSSGILRKLSRTPGNTPYRSRRRRRSLAIHCRSRSPIPSIPNLKKSGLSLSGHLIGCVPWSWYILT